MIFLFDLDGTLTDSKEGIINSFIYAFKKYGYENYTKEELNDYIGPPLSDTYMNKYKFNKEENDKLIDYFREYYSLKGRYENLVYDGIKELLENMYKNNISLGLATSKPEVEAIAILKHFGLYDYFRVISGASLDDSKNSKIEIIKEALNRLEYDNKEEVYMIGDRYTDIEAANKLKIKSIFALWGYATEDEFKNLKSDYKFKTPMELNEFVIKDIIEKENYK